MVSRLSHTLLEVACSHRASLVVSPDDFRVDAWGNYNRDMISDQTAVGLAFASFGVLLALPDIHEAFAIAGAPGAGKSTLAASMRHPHRVIFDATLTRPATRAELVRIARRCEKPIHLIVCTTPPGICAVRQESRDARRRVHPKTIEAIHEDLMNNPPSTAEGFASVRHHEGK